MKKILSVIAITFIAFSLITTMAFAENAESNSSQDAFDSSITTEGEPLEYESEISNGDTVSEERNPFDQLYEYISLHSGQILSSLAFITSCILVVLCKTGIIPLIKRGINAISAGVSSLNEGANKCTGFGDEIKKLISDKLDTLYSSLEVLKDEIDSYSLKLQSYDGLIALEEKVKLILNSQVEMLYEIFNSSSLPVYEKERIGEAVANMKKELNSKETEGE